MRKRIVVVVSVGGSLIVPDDIDTTFLRALKRTILSFIEKDNYQFILVAGGGKTARRYQAAARTVASLGNEDLDWLGIHATRINAHLLRTIFVEHAHPVVIKHPTIHIETNAPIIVAGGWKPGRSSDYVATHLAKKMGSTILVNLSNTDYVYDRDPREHQYAKPFKTLSWHQFRMLLPATWDPGLSAPFDPVAAKLAQRHGIEVAIINGARLPEMTKYFHGKPFKGTLVRG